LIHMVQFYKQRVMEKENIIAGNPNNDIKFDDNSDESAHAE